MHELHQWVGTRLNSVVQESVKIVILNAKSWTLLVSGKIFVFDYNHKLPSLRPSDSLALFIYILYLATSWVASVST